MDIKNQMQGVLGRVSTAVIKLHDQKQRREERKALFHLTTLRSHSVTEGGVRTGAEGKN